MYRLSIEKQNVQSLATFWLLCGRSVSGVNDRVHRRCAVCGASRWQGESFCYGSIGNSHRSSC